MIKRILVLQLTFFLIMTGVPLAVYADEPQITAEVDERKVQLYTVNLTLDDLYLASDVPPVLMEFQQQYRTLVPVAAIASYTGASVAWNEADQEVTITKSGKSIVLTINSAVVKVNGEEKTLPSQVPAKIVTYQKRGRTMVPVAFVGQELGLDVAWDEASRTVKMSTKAPDVPDIPPLDEIPEDADDQGEDYLLRDITVVMTGNNPKIRLKTGGDVSYSTAFLTGPDRLVFDLENTRLLMDDTQKVLADRTVRIQAPSNSYIAAVRSSQFEIDPYVVRLVLDMHEPIGHKITYDEGSGEMVISLVNYVDDVRFEQFNTREMIVIEGSNVSDYNIMHLDNPQRLVVDVIESVLNPTRKILDRTIAGRVTDKVRVSEFKPDHHYNPNDKIVRVVLDLNRSLSEDDLYIQEESGRLMVHLEGRPDDGFRYEETGWTTSRLTFFGRDPVNYQVVKEAGGELLRVTMPANNMDIPFQLLNVDDIMLNFIEMTEINGGSDLEASIYLKPGVEIAANAIENTRNLVLTFTNRDVKYREKLIVIDPGHGGSDPGAISPSLKMNEKEVNLEVALEARRLLEAAGFRVYMTRSDDSYVSLQDRAAVANQLRADLFISIHANAAPRSDLKGVETLYYPSEKNSFDFRENKFLAEIFQDEMVRVLGAASHRINAREKLVVLRETNMPAIITEIGFMSNSEEERLIASSDYRRRAAEGVRNAVIRYFEQSLTHLSARP
ncbi:MAG: N-acetylmuramoyl-L-alanine amidase [Bacillota bacterium]|nr:N-acetylmuramoyl-L-alanine amidase [Bacillota bacterium]